MRQQVLELFEKYLGPSEDQNDHFIIQLPDFYISNDYEDKHLISGMWLRIRLLFDEDKIYLKELRGVRTKQTSKEYSQHYFHSHLHSRKITNFEFDYFCEGSGEFGMASASVSAGCSIDEFEFFLMQLKNFITYEDTSNPYQFIKNLLPLYVETSVPEHSKTTILNLLKKSILTTQLKFNNNYELIDCGENHSILLSVLSGYVKSTVKINGRYLSYSTNYAVDKVNHVPKKVMTFKGEDIYTEIIDEPVNEIQVSDNLQHYVHPVQFDHISNILKNELQYKLLQEQYQPDADARLSYSNYIQGLSKQNQVLMLQNI